MTANNTQNYVPSLSTARPVMISPSSNPPLRRATMPQIIPEPPHTSLTLSTEPSRSKPKLYVQWNSVKATFIGFVGLVVCFFLVHHLYDLRKIKDLTEGVLNMNMVYYTVLNFVCVFAIGTGFGKPYSIFYLTLCGIIPMLVCVFVYRGLYEWMEKFLWLLGFVVLIIEYFYNGLMYRNDKERTE